MQILPKFTADKIIETMVSLLNAKTARSEVERECIYTLVGYAKSWISADYKLEKWPLGKPLSEDVQADLVLVTGSGGQPQFLPVHRAYSLTPEQAAELDIQQTVEERDANIKRDGRARASRLFAGFITSPYYAQLLRCVRCQKFFVNMRGHRNKKYCSMKCAHHHTAVKTMREQFEKERRGKLARIQNALDKLGSRPDRSALLPKWKQWVAKTTGADIRFVTRVTNNGEVLLPDWIPFKYRP